jgi:hypothetical protein
MKLSELKLLVDSLHDEMIKGGINDLELVIPNGKKSYGTISHTKVKYIYCGFDWDSNLLIIFPENKLVEQF